MAGYGIRLTLLLATLGLNACVSFVPVPQAYPPTFQNKMQAAHHWDVAASSIAQRLKAATSGLEGGRQLVLYLRRPPQGGFEQAFYDLLVTHLLAQGFGITDNPGAGLLTEYRAQIVPVSEDAFERAIAPEHPPFPTHEAIITVAIKRGDRYLTSVNDIYYISDYQYAQYIAGGPTRFMEVVGQ